jgi:uncharacterized protein YidB (DUF937 family)
MKKIGIEENTNSEPQVSASEGGACSCSSPSSGSAAAESWLKKEPTLRGIVIAMNESGQVTASCVSTGGKVTVQGDSIESALGKLFLQNKKDNHE